MLKDSRGPLVPKAQRVLKGLLAQRVLKDSLGPQVLKAQQVPKV